MNYSCVLPAARDRPPRASLRRHGHCLSGTVPRRTAWRLGRRWPGRPARHRVSERKALPGRPELEWILGPSFGAAWAAVVKSARPRLGWCFRTPDLLAHALAGIDSAASRHAAHAATTWAPR
jgi:hypothetical protein